MILELNQIITYLDEINIEYKKEEKQINIFANSTLYSHTVRRMMQLRGYKDVLNKTGMPRFKKQG